MKLRQTTALSRRPPVIMSQQAAHPLPAHYLSFVHRLLPRRWCVAQCLVWPFLVVVGRVQGVRRQFSDLLIPSYVFFVRPQVGRVCIWLVTLLRGGSVQDRSFMKPDHAPC